MSIVTIALPLKCPDAVDHSTDAEDFDLRREVAAFVATLPSEQRTALMLRLHQNLDCAEIAARLHYPAGQVRTSVYDALRLLQDRVGEQL